MQHIESTENKEGKMVKYRLLMLAGSLFLFSICFFIPVGGALSAEKTEILVGAVNSMTGVEQMTGMEQKWGYEQGVADINKKGGVFVKEVGKKLPLRLIFADDKSTPDQAAAAMERLIKVDKVDLLMSTDTSRKNLAAAVIAEKYRVFYLINILSPDLAEAQHFKWAADFCYNRGNACRMPFQIWDSLAETDKIKRPAVITEDDLDGQYFRDKFQYWSKKHGYEFVVVDSAPVGNKDFSSYILKIKASNADALIFEGPPGDGITCLRQAKDAQLKLRYIQGWKAFWPTEFVKAMGKDADYIIHDGFWSENGGNPGAKELGQRYTKQFGKDSVAVGLHYATPQILAMAIERAGSFDSARVRDAVFGNEFKGTVMGDIEFNKGGVSEIPCLGLQWWKGERMPVWPPIKGWKLKMIPVE
jgi:branched-chain amino acid transport system substrate-binding protein